MLTASEISKISGVRRVEVIGGQTLIEADCLEVMPQLGRFDAVVTDPPYGIGHKMTQGGNSPRNTKAIHGDDKPFDPKPFLHFPCLMFGADHFSERLPAGTFHVWDKNPNGAVQDSFSDAELFWTSWGGARRVFRHLWKGMCQASEKGGKQRWHPTQKPVALMEWCLGFLPKAQSILDPFMGSGTTLVACQRLGRQGTGIEIDPEYFEIACKRVEEATRQPDMFIAEPVAEAVQEELL